jgi:hypothetical protein
VAAELESDANMPVCLFSSAEDGKISKMVSADEEKGGCEGSAECCCFPRIDETAWSTEMV